MPKIVDWYMDGKINIDDLITHTMPLADINKGFDLMHAGETSIRSGGDITDNAADGTIDTLVRAPLFRWHGNNGSIATYSQAIGIVTCSYSVYLPPAGRRDGIPCRCCTGFPASLVPMKTSSTKAGAQRYAARARADRLVIAPDTSPRGEPEYPTTRKAPGISELGAGFYVNATCSNPGPPTTGCTTYITEELPALRHQRANCPVDGRTRSGAVRALNGRSRRAHHCLENTRRSFPVRVGLRTDLLHPARNARGVRKRMGNGYLGSEHREAWTSPRQLTKLIRSAAATQLPGSWWTRVRPTTSWRFSYRPTDYVETACDESGFATASSTHAARLRPQLLLHPDVHGRPPPPSRRATAVGVLHPRLNQRSGRRTVTVGQIHPSHTPFTEQSRDPVRPDAVTLGAGRLRKLRLLPPAGYGLVQTLFIAAARVPVAAGRTLVVVHRHDRPPRRDSVLHTLTAHRSGIRVTARNSDARTHAVLGAIRAPV